MKGKKKSIDEVWMGVLRKMTKEELHLIVYEQEDYTPKLVILAKEVLRQDYGFTEEMLSSIPEADNLLEGEVGTRKLFLEMLARLGCYKSIDFDNDSFRDDGYSEFSFSYLGENFYANAYDDSVYVSIEKCYGSVLLKDKDKVERIKETINRVNEDSSATMYYTTDDVFLFVACRTKFLLIPLIPNLDIYLHNQLKSLLDACQLFDQVLEELEQPKPKQEKENAYKHMLNLSWNGKTELPS